MEYRPYERADLPAVISLCEAEGWTSLPADPERANRTFTNPGVTTWVATDGELVGFAYVLSDGEIQAYLATMAVAAHRRREGIGRRLIEAAFAACGAERIDLLSDADGFYERLSHQKRSGFRLYPPFGG